MVQLSKYFSSEEGSAFAKAIPLLRAQIGVRPFDHEGSGYGVGANTFRAFVGWSAKPSHLYRKWAAKTCNQFDFRELDKRLSTDEGFTEWHDSLAGSLQAEWERQEGRPLSIAHQYKLVDLFIKWLSAHNLSSPELSESFVRRANCALDSQTLTTLNASLSLALPITKPSMGDIHSKNAYLFCQSLIEEYSVCFGGSRLLFDYFAWQAGGSGGKSSK